LLAIRNQDKRKEKRKKERKKENRKSGIRVTRKDRIGKYAATKEKKGVSV